MSVTHKEFLSNVRDANGPYVPLTEEEQVCAELIIFNVVQLTPKEIPTISVTLTDYGANYLNELENANSCSSCIHLFQERGKRNVIVRSICYKSGSPAVIDDINHPIYDDCFELDNDKNHGLGVRDKVILTGAFLKDSSGVISQVFSRKWYVEVEWHVPEVKHEIVSVDKLSKLS